MIGLGEKEIEKEDQQDLGDKVFHKKGPYPGHVADGG